MSTFPDSSPFGHIVTAHGDVYIDSSEFKFGVGSARFDGDGDYLTIPWNADAFDFGTENFTIDFWIRFASVSGIIAPFAFRNSGPPGDEQKDLIALFWSSDALTFQANSNKVVKARYSFAWEPATATWYHLAIVRDGGNFYIFLDGVAQSLTEHTAISSNSLSPTFGTPTCAIGRYGNFDDFYLDGWIDEFRILKGEAAWTSNFTPPTSAHQPP